MSETPSTRKEHMQCTQKHTTSDVWEHAPYDARRARCS